ncbi:MAG TPA: hypothetical protein VGH58_07615 [Solirubrobacterales bacterium]|jgi:hypothetical protein
MSSVAVFLVLGGGAAYAAKKIGSNEIKGNSITTGKLKKEAVTSSKIKKNAVSTAKIANSAVTGAKINLSTLGTVPNATHATTADTANNANNANNANAVNGMHVGRINFIANANTPNTTVFSADGLTLSASCDGGDELNFTATTSVSHSEIMESGNFDTTYKGAFDNDFNVGDVEEVGANIGDGTQEEDQGQLVYDTPSGAVVTAQFSLEDNGVFVNNECAVEGTVNFS